MKRRSRSGKSDARSLIKVIFLAVLAINLPVLPGLAFFCPAIMAAEPVAEAVPPTAYPSATIPAAPDCTAGRRIPRPSPVVLANVLYTAFAFAAVPAPEAKMRRGQMAAVRIYDPQDPQQTLSGDQILWEAGQVLSAGSPDERRIFMADAGELKPFSVQTVTAQILGVDAAAVRPDGVRWDVNGDGAVDDRDVKWLVQWVRGYRRPDAEQKKEWLLGKIEHSAPALMVPPKAPTWLTDSRVGNQLRASYRIFSSENRDRPTVLFVGAADGMLHVFDAGSFRWGDNPATPDITELRGYFRWEHIPADAPDYCFSYGGRCPNYGTGRELWAFIPSSLLPHLKYRLPGSGDAPNMDASPAVADVYLDTDGDGNSDRWKTVLVSAQGGGGDGMFCLDVTDPQSPAFMWEISASAIKRRRVAPAVVRIGRLLDNRTGRSRWAGFVVTGTQQNPRLYPAVLIFDLSTGNLLEKIVLDDAADPNGDGLLQADEADTGRGGVAGSQPAVVDSDGNGLIDRIYVTSDKGLVYKISLPDEPDRAAAGITHCVLNTDFSAADGSLVPSDRRFKPVIASPSVMVENSRCPDAAGGRCVWIFFGTGGSAHDQATAQTSGTAHLFFAYTDTAAKGRCSPQEHQLQWFIELPPGEHMLASAFAGAGQVIFGTAASARVDPCAHHPIPPAEEASLVAADLKGTVLFERSLPDALSAPLVQDLHLYLTLPAGPVSFGAGLYNNPPRAAGQLRVRLKAWQEVE